MPERTKYPNGTFCWPELATTDGEGAKKFYGAVFGWDLHDDPIGPDAIYTTALLSGKNVCAMYEQNAQQKEQGIPSHWLSYVSVDDIDGAVEKATSLGGAAVVGPMDVMEIGRMARLTDPTGAAFAMWQPNKGIGAQIVNEPGTLCWNELMTNDEKTSNKFYKDLFGWSSTTDNVGGEGIQYTSFANGDRPAAGMLEIQPEWGAIPPNWIVYFAVEDCDASAAAIEKNGGRVHSPPTDIPEVGRFAMCQDPQGAAFAIIALSRPTD